MNYLGTILLLIIIASAKLRSRIQDQELSEDVLLRLVYLLRSPTEGKFMFSFNSIQIWDQLENADEAGQSVRTSIIPAVVALRNQHCQTHSSLFSPQLLIGHLKDFEKYVGLSLSSDLDISDYFLNSFTLR